MKLKEKSPSWIHVTPLLKNSPSKGGVEKLTPPGKYGIFEKKESSAVTQTSTFVI